MLSGFLFDSAPCIGVWVTLEGWETEPTLQSNFLPCPHWGFVVEQDHLALRWSLVQEADGILAGLPHWCAGHVWTPVAGTFSLWTTGSCSWTCYQTGKFNRPCSNEEWQFCPLPSQRSPHWCKRLLLVSRWGQDCPLCHILFFVFIMKCFIKGENTENNIMESYFPIV